MTKISCSQDIDRTHKSSNKTNQSLDFTNTIIYTS